MRQRSATQLQQALNADDNVEALSALMDSEQAATLLDSFRRFSSRFPETRWRVSPGEAMEDGRPTVKLAVTGTRQQDGLSYSFRAYQRLALSTTAGLITGQQVLSDQSVLTSAKPLPISLMIPDTVLTGSRYDVDVVVDEPLGKALLAGGLTAVTAEQVMAQKSPIIQLAPLGGGGLFNRCRRRFSPAFKPGPPARASRWCDHREQTGSGGRRSPATHALSDGALRRNGWRALAHASGRLRRRTDTSASPKPACIKACSCSCTAWVIGKCRPACCAASRACSDPCGAAPA